MKSFLLLVLVMTLSLTAQAQQQELLDGANLRVHLRHVNKFYPLSDRFRLIETVQHEPIFAKLPFLKLRVGDQIVRGQFLRRPFGKGMKAEAPETWSQPGVFLQRAGSQMRVNSLENAGSGRLSRNDIAYFSWEPTRANADALFEICRPDTLVSLAQLAALDLALQPEFAEYLTTSLTPFLETGAKISPGFVREVRDGEELKFVYAGLALNEDLRSREIFQFRITLGANEWTEERATLISAPPGFHIRITDNKLINNFADTWPRDPASQRRLEAKNARFFRFNSILDRVLYSK